MSQEFTTNTYKSLQDECRAAGLSLSEACRLANVDRSAVQRWRTKEPKTLKTLAAIRNVLSNHQNKHTHEKV